MSTGLWCLSGWGSGIFSHERMSIFPEESHAFWILFAPHKEWLLKKAKQNSYLELVMNSTFYTSISSQFSTEMRKKKVETQAGKNHGCAK